jgi:hypothetical protein
MAPVLRNFVIHTIDWMGPIELNILSAQLMIILDREAPAGVFGSFEVKVAKRTETLNGWMSNKGSQDANTKFAIIDIILAGKRFKY